MAKKTKKNNNKQNITWKTNDRATRTQNKTVWSRALQKSQQILLHTWHPLFCSYKCTPNDTPSSAGHILGTRRTRLCKYKNIESTLYRLTTLYRISLVYMHKSPTGLNTAYRLNCAITFLIRTIPLWILGQIYRLLSLSFSAIIKNSFLVEVRIHSSFVILVCLVAVLYD